MKGKNTAVHELEPIQIKNEISDIFATAYRRLQGEWDGAGKLPGIPNDGSEDIANTPDGEIPLY